MARSDMIEALIELKAEKRAIQMVLNNIFVPVFVRLLDEGDLLAAYVCGIKIRKLLGEIEAIEEQINLTEQALW